MYDANVLAVDCGGRDSVPAYSSFCGKLGIRHLVVVDGDSSKQGDASILRKVNAVRASVADAAALARLFEFSEDIEHAFGLSVKSHDNLLEAALVASLDRDEPGQLAAELRAFVTDQPRADRPGI